MKACAIGGLTFGHELGHNFGCTHDIYHSDYSAYPYGHGHHIEQGSATTGYRTIMAYPVGGHWNRVNYYSNPAVDLPITGTPTGVAGVSNNAKVIRDNRFIFAAIGDESATCSDGTVSTPSTPAPTEPPPGNNRNNYFS